MRLHLPFLPSFGPLFITLMIAVSGCSRSDFPTGSSEQPEAVPTRESPPSPNPTAKTDQTPPATTPKQRPGITTVDLPAPVDDVCVAAGGKLLVLRLKDQQKLTAFDLGASKIIGHVALADPQDIYAAGVEKLMVVGRKSRLVKRYSLPDLKPEAERSIPGALPIVDAGMGASSRGPLFVVCEAGNDGSVFVIEPATLYLSEHTVAEMRRAGGSTTRHARISVSSDGSVFCLWQGPHLSYPRGLAYFAYDDRMKYSFVETSGSAQGTYVCPDDRGERLYAGYKRYKVAGEQVSREELPLDTQTFPAIGGPYYLTIPPGTPQVPVVLGSRASKPTSPAKPLPEPCVQVWLEDESKPMASLPIADFTVLDPRDGTLRARGSFYQRLFLFPTLQAIVELPNSANSLVVHHLDMDKEVRCAVPDRPIVLSRPPRTHQVGEKFRYQIQAISTSGKPTFKLDSGPEGMVVSETGLVEWTPPLRLSSSSVSAVISIEDGGKSKFHTLALNVRPPADFLVSAVDGPPPGSWGGDKPMGNLRLILPAAYSDVCVGGNGRFLVFTFPSIQKAAIFDVVAAKITGYVPIAGEQLVAAGMDKLVVVDPEQATIERFDLSTQKREDKQSLSLRGEAKCVGMGSASQGPVILVAATDDRLSHVQLRDLQTLMPPDYTNPEGDPRGILLKSGGRVYVSADGQVFGIVGSNEAWTLAFTRGEIVRRAGTDFFPGWMIPDETGDHIHTVFGIIGDSFRTLKRPNNSRRGPDGYYIPAVHGPLYLQFPSGSASLCRADEDQPLAPLPNLPFPELSLTSWPGDLRKSTMDRRVYLIPNARLIVMLPGGQESVVLCPFDLDQILSRSGDDYLAVVSCPPRKALPGKTFEYQLDVRSKAGKVECRLESGPKGMQVSAKGLVRWDVKDPPDERTASARITVSDGSGKSVQHKFELSTGDAPVLPVSTPATLFARRTDLTVRSEPGLSLKSLGPTSWQLTPMDDHRMKVSNQGFMLRPGLNRQSMLLLQDKRLAVLSADGMTVLATHELKEQYRRIAERNDYYVAIAQGRFAVDLLDKNTLATIRRISGGKELAGDLALHPARSLSYVTVFDSDGHNGAFVVVDEATGEVHASKEEAYLGRWVDVDAAGHRLVTAGQYVGRGKPDSLVVERLDPSASSKEHLSRTSKPLPVPNLGDKSRWTQVPGQSDDWSTYVLAVYNLAADGEPRLSASNSFPFEEMGGLRLAPDGRRATLTRVIDERTAVNLDALNEKPIAYLIPGRPVFDLAYHPTLPLVACVGSTGPKLFERETGKLLPAGVKYPAAELEDAQFHRVWFSADGKGLLLEVTVPEVGRCLYRAEFDWSPADLAHVEHRGKDTSSPGREPSADRAAEPSLIPLSEIDAFRGGRGQEMSAQEVARASSDAVVVVNSGRRSATGFVVGASGYVLTCARSLREADGIIVSYRSKEHPREELQSVPAKLLRIDQAKDLVLLRIEGAAPLPALRLALGNPVENGEPVTILGSSGAGKTVTNDALSEGTVSSAQRKFGRQVLIQTSASAMPGFGGAPLFNRYGLVIGMVVIRPNAEGAGFAVPASELGAFLATVVKAAGSEGAIQRQWFDTDYKHGTIAQYLGLRDGAVQLRRADGTEISVPLTKLSPQDQAFVRLFQPDAAGQ